MAHMYKIIKWIKYMRTNFETLCIWSGILCTVVLFIGWWPIANFFPPHSPISDADFIAAIYQENTNAIRFGCLLIIISGGLYVPFNAVIATQLKRIKSPETRVIVYTQICCGAAGTLFFLLPGLSWTIAAFRPDRAVEITQTLNDTGWILLVMPFALFSVQDLAIGGLILSDRSKEKIFPRWIGFFNLWCAILFIPGGLLTFFKVGPFAWDGILAFWIPGLIFFTWFYVMSYGLFRAVSKQNRLSKTTI
ncbi:hypothetical protein AB4876_18665 [Zhongshania guokunii]|uniref:DUF4386 domain-containing protein n=1 Tax=Zhongshania guokunii TaxID=641783 RepID=A0ABV3UBT0_9GAMM